jgi:anti-sigma factor RsiW
MITCRELADCLCDLVAGELPPPRRADVEQHLRVCPPCVALLESYQVTIRLARQLPPAPMPPRLVSRLQAALQAPPAP